MKKVLLSLMVLAVVTAFSNQSTQEESLATSFDYVEEVEVEEIEIIDTVVEEVIEVKSYDVTATMYYPVVSQCDADPLVTAGMYHIDPYHASEHKWIAMSRNLLKRWGGDFDYGDKVVIKGAGDKDGVYTVTDTMNERYENRIDILETKGTPLYKYDSVTIVKV